MDDEISRILRVRKTRERSIRARIDTTRREIEALRGTIASALEERGRVRALWHEARAQRGILDHLELQAYSERLSDLYARDVAIQSALDGYGQQMSALEQQLDNVHAELRVNLVGQEKLGSLIDHDAGTSSRGGGLL